MDLSRLNPFAISGLLIVITYTPFFLLIIRNGKTALTRIYSFFILSVLLWGVACFLIGANKDYNSAILIWRASYVPAIFTSVFFCHSVFLATEKSDKRIIHAIYSQGIIFALLSISGKMFSNVTFMFDSFYYHKGNIFFLLSFIFWLLIVSIAYYWIISYYYRYHFRQKAEFLALALSLLGFSGGITNFLPGLGINIFPYGNFLIIVPPFIVSYIILRHQVLDIVVVFRKSVVYSILLAIITLSYLAMVILSERLLQGIIGYQSILISVSVSFSIGLAFFPLKNKIQHLVDNFFFHGTHEEIVEENERLRQEIERTEKLKSVSILASGIAHEIKNPLTAIKTFTEYLPQKLNDKEFLSNFSRIVGREVERIDDLVHELLEFAKPSPLNLQEVKIVDLLDNTLGFLNSSFIKNHITVVKDYDPSMDICVKADTNRLRQVFLNILLNSIDAMNKGGRLSVSIIVANERIRLSIEDNGVGIDKKDLKYIFDPFYTKKDHGVGLGLSITQRIIHDHGGKIFVESISGKGTKFILELPGTNKV